MQPWLTLPIVVLALTGAIPVGAAPIVRFESSGPDALTMTGNTLGLAGDLAGPAPEDRIGVFIDAGFTLQVPGWPLGTTDDWALASSEAVLDLPAGATVVYAELVWGGTINPDAADAGEVLAAIDGPVLLDTPSGERFDVAPATGAALGSAAGTGYYGRSADVTSLIVGGGSYRVGAVPSTLDADDAAAGWSLYVVYRDDALPPRRIALVTFMSYVAPATDNDDVTAAINGLCIHASAADRDARLALTVIDGDADIGGDSFRLARQQGQLNGDGARVSGVGAPADNLYGGRITTDLGTVDSRGSFGSANHEVASNVAGARQGWDVLTVQVAPMLDTNWQSAWLRGSAGDDAHGLLAVGLSSRLRSPYVPDGDALSADATTPGGPVTFTATLHNRGDSDASAATFELLEPLPEGIRYVANSFAVDGAPPPDGPVEDAAAFSAGVDLGTIAVDATVVVTLQLVFEAPTVAQWSFVPRVTYANAVCGGARTDPFTPPPIGFTFDITTCGDGQRDDDEACDDGDGDAGDGCDAACTIEPGWRCPPADGPSRCSEDCGDGLIVGAEACDDGVPQGDLADGCGSDCRGIDHGWACLGAPSDCQARCGDGLIAVAVEICDDGNLMGADGCAADCTRVELGWSCLDEPSECAVDCGDGTLRGDEQCDDGGLVDGDGCTSECRFEATWICTQDSPDTATLCRKDSDDDGVLDDGDESGDPYDNPCAEGGPSVGCDDNCPDFANSDQTFPADSLLCPVYFGPRTRGGGGCAGADGPLTDTLLTLVVLAALALRRARARRGAVVALLVLGAGATLNADARAQEFDPRLFEPTLSPLGVLGVETSATSGHLRPWVNLIATFADDELATQTGPARVSSGPMDGRFMLTFGAGLGLFDRFDLAVGFPLAITSTTGADRPTDSDMGMTDLRILARGRLFGPQVGGSGPGLALALHMTFPTGSDAAFMSDGAATVMPQVVLDYRSADGFVASLNVGVRVRPTRTVVDLTVSDELRFGLGAEIPVGFYGFAFTAEIDGAVSLGDSAYDGGGVAAREFPVEALGGLRWRSGGGITVSGAVGSGLTEGYGAPDFRVLFGLAFNVPSPERYVEPIVPASKNERRDDWHARLPAEREKRSAVTDAQFDQLAAADPDPDGDAVPIPRDVCPDIPEDRDGFSDDDGCPDPDDDEDGVLDADDKCPNELEVLNGVDDYDGCHDEPNPVAGSGIKDNQIEIKDRIRFKPGSAELLPSDKLILDEVALVMRANVRIKRFRIEGHTDNMGDREFNVDLAERRAWSVRSYLIEKGIDETRLFPKGFGSIRPVAKNNNEAGRAQNRRVEFHVIRDGEPSEGDVP